MCFQLYLKYKKLHTKKQSTLVLARVWWGWGYGERRSDDINFQL